MSDVVQDIRDVLLICGDRPPSCYASFAFPLTQKLNYQQRKSGEGRAKSGQSPAEKPCWGTRDPRSIVGRCHRTAGEDSGCQPMSKFPDFISKKIRETPTSLLSPNINSKAQVCPLAQEKARRRRQEDNFQRRTPPATCSTVRMHLRMRPPGDWACCRLGHPQFPRVSECERLAYLSVIWSNADIIYNLCFPYKSNA